MKFLKEIHWIKIRNIMNIKIESLDIVVKFSNLTFLNILIKILNKILKKILIFLKVKISKK
jgi:hypothetical protein